LIEQNIIKPAKYSRGWHPPNLEKSILNIWKTCKLLSAGTKPELIIRHILENLDISYRKNVNELVGTPDIVIDELQLIIFVHGCYFHGHSCASEYQQKNEEVAAREALIFKNLKKDGWRIQILWECQIRCDETNVARRLKSLVSQLKKDR
tara:strand:- start:444 stop:893 length:450 start_codon:yes stop_codon:yes gene_type:complete